MGLFLRVLRRCIRGVTLTTLGAVVSSDAVGAPTLRDGPFTLGTRLVFSISVNSLIIFACFSFILVDLENVSFAASNSSAAAMSVISPSKIVGILQWVGNNLVELAIHVARVVGIQKRWHL